MSQDVIAVLLTIFGFGPVLLWLIYISHPDWFRFRQRGTPVSAETQYYDDEPEYFEPIEQPHFRSQPPVFMNQKADIVVEDFIELRSTEQVDEDFIKPLTFPNRPVIPVKDASFGPKRRSDYQFCIGTFRGEQHWFPLGHILLTKKTRGGKTNCVTIIVGQAIQQGIEVWYADVSHKPVSEDGLDARPLIRGCVRVATQPTGTDQLALLQDALRLIEERTIQSQERGESYFPPVLLILEEAKAFQDKLALLEDLGDDFKGATKRSGHILSSIISTGAGVNVNLMLVTQDAQNGTLNMTRGSVNNFETKIFHPSLDPMSLVNVLPKGYDIKHHPLPKPNEQQLASTTSRPWFVASGDTMGTERITLIDIPRVLQSDITKYTANIPARPQTVKLVEQPGSAHELWPVQPDLPTIAQPAHPPSVPPESTARLGSLDATVWHDDHVKTAAWIVKQKLTGKKVTQRGLAEYLYAGKNEGRYNTRAGAVLAQVCRILDIDLGTGSEQDEDLEL